VKESRRLSIVVAISCGILLIGCQPRKHQSRFEALFAQMLTGDREQSDVAQGQLRIMAGSDADVRRLLVERIPGLIEQPPLDPALAIPGSMPLSLRVN
jgi:hypothetical protein